VWSGKEGQESGLVNLDEPPGHCMVVEWSGVISGLLARWSKLSIGTHRDWGWSFFGAAGQQMHGWYDLMF
jgi:hypothetical protein